MARKVSRYLKISQTGVLRKITRRKNSRFVWVKRHLDKSQYDHIRSWRIRGLGFIREPKRLYPNESLLGQVLGFVGRDKGLEGLEKEFDETLQGEQKKVEVLKDARGRSLVEGDYLFNSIRDGEDLHLTVDSEIQYVLQKELAYAVKEHEAKSAVGVVLDAQTSEVLAMASVPDFDPNRPGRQSTSLRRNRVVTDIFEPGSTMKTFVVAGALREKIAKPTSKYYCENGMMRVGRRIIREADRRHAFEDLTVSEILAKSSNIGTTKIAFDLGSGKLKKTLTDFGFGEKTKLHFPGEARGIVQKLPWHQHLLSNISFGHGIATTPLQVANAYAVIANGGVLYKPTLTRSSSLEERKVRRVLSEGDAQKMRMMLTGVTQTGGTGMNARVKGFLVAGKTGTAQKVNPNGRGYLQGHYVSSFAGFIPADKPRFVVYVAVDSPKKGYYGSQVAAPVFSKVASFAVRNYGLSPLFLGAKEKSSSPKKSKSLTLPMNRSSLQARAIQSIRRNLRLEKGSLQVVPNLHRLTLREVYQVLGHSDIKLKVRGKGRVSSISPRPGQRIPKNKTVNILLE